MIIIIPLAFAGASYINGEDPVQNFKQLVGIEQAAEQPQADEAPAPQKETATASSAEELKQENERLRKELEQRDQAIKDLQKELEACQ